MVRGEGFKGFADFAQHALARGAENLLLQSFTFGGREECGELDDPGGGLAREELDDGCAVGTPGELAERFEDRVVGLFTAEAFQALAASDRDRRVKSEHLLECVGYGGLSDARFASHEYHLTAALEDLFEAGVEIGELSFAANGNRRGGGRRLREAAGDGRNELVTPLGEGADKARLFGFVAERLTQLEDVSAKDFRLDVGFRPEGFEQLFLGDEASGMIDQVA